MKLEIICTFENMAQEIKVLPFVLPILRDKNTLIDFCYHSLKPDQQNNLIKISCCIYLEERQSIIQPTWYKECKGKIWIDDLELYRHKYSLPSDVTADYVRQFNNENSNY